METAAVKRKKLVEQLTVLDQAAAQLKELKTIKEERESQLAEAKAVQVYCCLPEDNL